MNILLAEKEGKLVVERSKFFSFSFFCDSLAKQSELVKKMRAKFASATHICYASIIDEQGIKMYANDDGEPSGTAGLPILSILKENQLVNVICFVVRFFGGVKLGVSGLIKAYKESANIVVEDNTCLAQKKCLYKINFGYPNCDKITKIFAKRNIEIAFCNYGEEIEMHVYLDEEDFLLIKDYLANYEKTLIFKYCKMNNFGAKNENN